MLDFYFAFHSYLMIKISSCTHPWQARTRRGAPLPKNPRTLRRKFWGGIHLKYVKILCFFKIIFSYRTFNVMPSFLLCKCLHFRLCRQLLSLQNSAAPPNFLSWLYAFSTAILQRPGSLFQFHQLHSSSAGIRVFSWYWLSVHLCQTSVLATSLSKTLFQLPNMDHNFAIGVVVSCTTGEKYIPKKLGTKYEVTKEQTNYERTLKWF